MPLLALLLVAAVDGVDLRLDTSEAEAVLAIVGKETARKEVESNDWERLFKSEPYVRLKQRESSMGRDFTDEDFQRFVLSPEVKERAGKLKATLAAWRKADLSAAARRALQYLPGEARLRATVYPTIKPRPNSFVWETTTSPAIFLYLDPDVSPAQFQNTVAHELHHIGLASLSVAYDQRIAALPPNARKAAQWMGALGEGVAMLAAAGSPDVDPVAAFGKADQVRWKQDMAGWDIRLRELDQFFADVIDGGFARPEVADHVAATFFGYRGPWYQVGYMMAITIEKQFGRETLVATMSDPRAFVAKYNEAAARTKQPVFRQSTLQAVGIR